MCMANIEEIILCQQTPDANNITRGDAIRSGEPKARIGVIFEPHRVVMLVRTYDEVDSNGTILDGFNNGRRCAYYHLPLLCLNPMDYYVSSQVLGQVRLKQIHKINRRDVTRMYVESHRVDKRDLVAKHARGE